MATRKRHLLLLFATVFIYSCDFTTYKLTIIMNDGGGLLKDTKVVHNGVEIGNIKSFKVDNKSILYADLSIHKTYLIPLGSVFSIKKLPGSVERYIDVSFANGEKFHSNNDTIKGYVLRKDFSIPSKADSLQLYELLKAAQKLFSKLPRTNPPQ